MQVFGRACILVFSVVFATLFLGGRGEKKRRGPAHCILGTNGHVHAIARVCASGLVMGGKKAVVSGGMCTCLCACMCSAYVCYMYVVLLLVWG